MFSLKSRFYVITKCTLKVKNIVPNFILQVASALQVKVRLSLTSQNSAFTLQNQNNRLFSSSKNSLARDTSDKAHAQIISIIW